MKWIEWEGGQICGIPEIRAVLRIGGRVYLYTIPIMFKATDEHACAMFRLAVDMLQREFQALILRDFGIDRDRFGELERRTREELNRAARYAP